MSKSYRPSPHNHLNPFTGWQLTNALLNSKHIASAHIQIRITHTHQLHTAPRTPLEALFGTNRIIIDLIISNLTYSKTANAKTWQTHIPLSTNRYATTTRKCKSQIYISIRTNACYKFIYVDAFKQMCLQYASLGEQRSIKQHTQRTPRTWVFERRHEHNQIHRHYAI